MLESLKGLTGGGRARKQSDDLEGLMTAAREERSALSAMLTQLTIRGSKLLQLGKSLDQVDQKAGAATAKMDDMVKRLDGLEARANGFAAVEKRVQTLIESATEAQQVAEKLMAADGELQAHRRQVQQLSSQALETQASIVALKKERAMLEEFRTELRQSQTEIKQSVDGAAVLRGELDQVRGTSTQLSQDYAKLRQATREAGEDSTAAVERVKDVEKKLGPLMQLIELTKTTEEKLTLLNALAEHVTQKAKVLESQKYTIDRAVVEANRLNEMVWGMDVQVSKLNDGLKQVARSEETIGRVEKLVEDTNARVGAATQLRDEFARESVRLEKDGRALVDLMRNYVEKLALEKKEFEAFDLRLRILQGSVGEAEARMESMAGKEKHLSQLNQHVDGLTKDFQGLMEQADELSKKHASLDTLQDQFIQVDELSKRTSMQYESLKQSRVDLDVLRKEIQDFHKAHAEIAQLRDKVGADRSALEAFGDRLTSFKAQTPELESTMDAVLGRLALVAEGTKQATRLGELATDLDTQLTRVTGRIQFVDKLEGRINSLHVMTTEVDQKLAEQLARRTELDTLKTQCDGVIVQMLDAQQRLEAVNGAQMKLIPITARVATLENGLDSAVAQFKEVQCEEAAIEEQQGRLVELLEQSRVLASETAERMKQMQALGEELQRSAAAKDELIGELSRVQQRQRDALAQAEAAEDQVKRAETMYKALEQRRTQLAFSERRVAGIEIRMTDLAQKSANLNQQISTLADREKVVAAVKAEVDGVHQISAKSRADLEYISDHRADVAVVQRQMQELFAKAAGTNEKIAAIDARRKTVDEVQSKANLIVNLLEDVRANLDSVAEQKTVIDHVAEKLAKFEFLVQEAQNTQRTLQHERELAERIEHSIKQLRTRTTTPGRKNAATA